MFEMTECSLSKCDALSLNPSTAKKKKRETLKTLKGYQE
jgi:hypothetical protein